ncbi:MAG: UDP-N-acetylmuramate dehydrogenase [Candidatus Auribacterota bacterium]|jgi:UDP-N-acetylenolpyruvoylglucosamine reductase|nr:UDP-N-acetylmuramate dehydrogenase [Candidatus Auribacterota bacterium]
MTVLSQFVPLEMYFQKNPSEGLVQSGRTLARYTGFHCGGKADFFCDIYGIEGLKNVVMFCNTHSITLNVLGFGTNVLIADEGICGAVVRLTGLPFLLCERLDEARFRVGSRVSLQKLIGVTCKAGLSGCEWLVGIPASLGGAVRLNAGAYGHDICESVESITVMKPDGCLHTIDISQRLTGYRQGPCEPDEILVYADMAFSADDVSAISERMTAISAERKRKIPPGRHAGCVFKNPPSIPAGKLLDELGCKGIAQQGACVSIEHANIIVNKSNAGSSDILTLIERLINKARSERNIELELELTIWR